MGNELVTRFTIESSQAEQKADRFKSDLISLNQQLNNLDTKPFSEKFKSAFTDLDSRLVKTRTEFQKLSQTKLEKGQFDLISQGAIVAERRVSELTTRVRALRKEASDPANAQFGKYYAQGIREAENELSRYERQLARVSGATSGGAGGGSKSGGGRAIPNLRGFGAVFRETGLTGYGINEGAINAASQLAGVAEISAATLGIFGGIAVAGLAIVAVTKSIREEAERHLKIEEKIQSTVNNFILGRQKLLSDLKQARDDAGFNRDFSRFTENSSEDVLKGRRANAKTLLDLNPSSEFAERYKKEILDIDARLDAIKQQKLKSQDDAFNKRGDDNRKSAENSLEVQRKAAEKQIEAQKRFNESVEQGKTKAKELEKNYISAFDSLYEKSNADNPFAKIFTEADKQLRTLKETLRGLPQELQTTAIGLQNKISGDALFSAELNNSLDVFDLRDRAANFRNPFDPRKGLFNPAEPFAFPNSDFFTKGDEERKRILAKQNAPVSSFSPLGVDADTRKQLDDIRERARQDQIKLNEETIKRNDELAKKNQNDFINRRLERQVSIINADARSPEEKAIADRKLISLSSGLNPNDIKKDLRESIALANERDSDRKERSEADGRNLDRERNKTLSEINENQKKFIEIAEKQGLAGIKNLIEIVDKTDGKANVSTTPNNDDVANYFGGGFN